MDITSIQKMFTKPIHKDDILSTIDYLEKDLVSKIIPVLKESSRTLGNHTLHTEEAIQIVSALNRNYSNGNTDIGRLLGAINRDLNKIKALYPEISSRVLDIDKEVITKNGLTITTATIMDIISHLSFINEYTLKFTDYVLTCELNSTDELPPSVVNYVKSNVAAYGVLLDFYTANGKNIFNNIDKLPDIVIEPEKTSIIQTIISKYKALTSLNRMTSGFIGNPFYHIGLFISEIQVERYQSNKDRKRLIELKLMQLKEQQQNNPNPKLEKQIEYYQNRVIELDYKIKKFEESLNDN